jgi:hypothetical protein
MKINPKKHHLTTLPMPKKIQRNKKSNPKVKPKPVCLYCKEESTFDEHTTECDKCGRYQDLYNEKGQESELYCDIHEELHLKHDGDEGYYCDECDEESEYDPTK